MRVTSINFLLTKSIHNREKGLWKLIKWSQKENDLIFCQILSMNSLEKCIAICLVNLNLDIGVLKVWMFCDCTFLPAAAGVGYPLLGEVCYLNCRKCYFNVISISWMHQKKVKIGIEKSYVWCMFFKFSWSYGEKMSLLSKA